MAGSLFSNAVISFFINTQQAKSQLNSFQQAFNGGISRMRNMVLGFIGAQGLKGYYDSLLRIVDVADRFHLPVEQVSAFTNVFASLGGTADEAISHIEKLQQLANDLKFHSSGALRDLGAILNVNLANKNFQGVIDALRTGMAGLSNDAKTEVLRILGSDSVAFQRMLELSNDEYAQVLERANEYGVLTQDNAQSLREMRQTLAEIKQSLLDLALPFVKAFQPVIEIVRNVIRWFGSLNDETKQLIAYLTILAPIIKGLLGGSWIITGLGVIDVFNGWIAGLRKAHEEGAELQDVLDEMAKKSYVLNITLQIANKLGEWLSDVITNVKGNVATGLVKRGWTSDPKQLIRAEQWMKTHPDYQLAKDAQENLQIAKFENSMELARRGREMFGNPAWMGKQSPVATNDNRTMTFNIYGVNGADDLQDRLMTIINNNTNSTVGWAQ